jgi:hypothetical protein
MRMIQHIDGERTNFHRMTNVFVLDTQYPYPEEHPPLTADSPANGVPSPAGTITALERDDDFEMYLLWKPDSAGAQYVPLRIVQWEWGFDISAGSPGGTWILGGSYHSTNPPSQNTYVVPEWTSNVNDFGWIEGD